jgi:hypothetical protein
MVELGISRDWLSALMASICCVDLVPDAIVLTPLKVVSGVALP